MLNVLNTIKWVAVLFALLAHLGMAIAQSSGGSLLAYPEGTVVTIDNISPNDGWYFRLSALKGLQATVSSTHLISSDNGTWWKGDLTLLTGEKIAAFSEVAVRSSVTPSPYTDIDTSPIPFTLKAVSGAIPGASVVSEGVTVKGINAATPISISGGEYAINGGAFTSQSGTVTLDQVVTVRVVASSDIGKTVAATLTIGGIASNFTVTTVTTPGDYSPNPFSFLPITNATPSASVVSEKITVSGISADTTIAISGGEYAVNEGTWTSVAGTVSLGNQIQVRLTAPSGFGATGSATLTIGGVSANFTVGTRSFVAVIAPTEVFTNPQTAVVTGGLVSLDTPPAAPLQLAATARPDAVVILNTASPITVTTTDNTNLTYTRLEDNTSLQVRTVAGAPALVTLAGSVRVEAAISGSSIPVAADTTGSASLKTSTANAQVVTGRDTERNVVVAIPPGSGKVTYTSIRRGRALPNSFDVYPGEAVLADESGAAGQVRIGSFTQDASQAGDFISSLPRAASSLKVPRVTTDTSPRFGNKAWTDIVAQAIATKLGLGTATSLTQDASTGIMTLLTTTGTYRFLPVGSLALAETALGAVRAVSVADIAANLTAILDSSLSFAVAPATAYADLERALKNINFQATLEVLGDGVLRAKLYGIDYIAQPAAQISSGSAVSCPGFVSENNLIALCDASGYRQILFAAFADTNTLLDTFRTDLGLPSISVSNTGTNGIYSATVNGIPYALAPEITLSTPPASQAGKLWWIDPDSSKIFIRYPQGTAQGFSLQ